MAATHVIRTTFRPTDEITVSHDEYEDLLERGLIYDGTPPDPIADPLDAHLAEYFGDPASATMAALRSAFVAGAVFENDGTTVSTAKKLSVVLTADGTDIEDLIIEDVA